MSAALLHGMQANATQQMGLFGRIEQRWGVFRYTLSREGECSYDAMLDVMKNAQLDRLTLKNEAIRKYFPRSYTPRQMEETILKLLEQWHKKRHRSQER